MNNKDELLSKLESQLDVQTLTNAARQLNLVYTLYTSDENLWAEVKRAFDVKYSDLIDVFSKKSIANKFINEIIIKYYPCERSVKYAIVEKIKKKKDTVLFEMPVLKSRVDVCRINGNSFAYEIKTEFDTYKRLKNQMEDYSKVFEYVYIVVPFTSAEDVIKTIPDYCGVILYKHEIASQNYSIIYRRKPLKSPNLNSIDQLSCLTRQSLNKLYNDLNIKKISSTKDEDINYLIENVSSIKINAGFKKIVKSLYYNNWNFVQEHYREILPIDLQAFFSNSSISPSILYYKET